MTFKTLLSDINNVALAMESLKKVTQFNTGSTIANEEALSNVAIEQYKASIDGLNLSQAQAALSATALNDAQKQQILTSAGLLENTQAITLEEVKQMASSAALSTQKKEEILATLQGAYSEGQWNTERLEAIASGEGEAATIAQTILAKKAESAENVKNIAGRKALTASLKEELAARIALMASNPVAWIVGIAAVSAGLIALQKKFSKSLEECTEDLKKYNSEFENSQSTVKSLESELDTCQTRLAELQKLADNGTLSIVEQEEYERLQKTNDELERNLKIEREKAQLNAIDGAKTADETVNKKVQSNYIRGDVDSYEGVVLHDQLLNVTPKEELEGAITEYNRLQGEIDKLNKSYDNGSISSEDYTTRLNGLTKAQATARTRASEMSDILVECEQSYNNLENTGGKFTTTSKQNYDSVKLANQEYASFLDIVNGINDSLNNRQSYEDTINRFKSSEESSLDELTQKYDEAIAKRKELYSGENYVGNVDINNRPVVINDDGSYSTTSTAFQEKWVGDEENGHYIIAHFTPILPDGTVLDEETLNDYIDRILNSDNPMEADKPENGGYGIVYKIDTEINGQEINDGNLEDAFGIADAWDVDMHNLQDKMYASEAEIKSQIENFEGGIDSSQTIKNFFDTKGINTQSLINEFNEVTDGITNADEAIQKWNEHKNSGDTDVSFPDLTSLVEKADSKDAKTQNLAWLQTEADLLKTVQKEMSETGKVGVSSMQSIIKQFPEAKQALSEYMAGLIDEQELFAQLEQVYEDDKNAYADKIYEQMETTTQFLENISQDYPDFFNFLSNLYQDDLGNYTTVAELKKEIDTALVSALDSLWRGHYQLIQDKATGLYSAIIDDQAMLDGTISEEESDNILNGISDEVERANSALTRLNEIKNSYVNQISDNASWQSLGKDLSSSSDSSSGSDSSSEPSPQDFNWVEPLLSKISKAYDRLKNKVSDTTRTWLNRNNALSDSMETLLSEINAQSDAYDFYMDRFNSYDLDGYYKDQIANGSFNIETVYDEDLKDAISDCQDLYDKAQDAADSVQSLNIEIRQLAKSRFDNIQSQFEEVLGKVNSIKDLYSKDNDLLEEQGWFASTLLNNSMIEQEQKNLVKLEQERDALTKALNSAMASGKIEAESEDWYSMQASIDDVTSSIFDAKKALVEYDNAIRQINWDAFDRTRDDVSNLIDETQFLVDLLKNEDITDDNGNMNDNGKAAQALIAQKYQLYLNQAKAYKDEILKINEELANDPYDKELLDRKQELIKAQQEAINSSISEKDALKDLVQEGYDTFLDKLDEVIQKYKDLMSQQKDAYDYEKSIKEKTKALNALEKQYSAYQGDNSEEGKKNIQQLKDQINTAKDDLKDTEYEKLISDTQAILDNLADTTKTWLDERLDSFDVTMQEIIDQSNENASNISQTITSTAENYGYKLSESMSNIWSTNASNITNGINSVLGDFSNKFVEGNNAINKVCGDINAAVQGLLKNSNDEAQRVADEIARQQAEQNANTDGGYSDGGGSSGGSNDWSDNWDNSDSGSSDDGGSWGDWFYHLEDDYPKDLLEVDSSIVDRLKYNDIDSSFGARADYYSAMGGDGEYYGSSDQNIWMLDQLKSHGYKNGTKSATAGIHRTDEKGLGSEVIFSKKYGTLRKLDAGDMVFNADQVEKLWNLSKGITTPNMYMDNLGAKLPDIPNISNNLANKVDVEFGDVTLSLPNVKNYEDFMKQAQQDPKFEKMVQNMTLGQTLGRNSLSKLTFR